MAFVNAYSGQNMVFGLYVLGIGFAVLTGLVLKNTLLKGEITPFVMELPPYHLPTFRGVVLRTWERLKTFMFRAGKVILSVVIVLSFLNSLGTDGSFGNEDSETSVLSAVGRTITPVFSPVGLSDGNWPAAVGIFTGIFAKEAVVGTLDALYAQMDADDTDTQAMLAQWVQKGRVAKTEIVETCKRGCSRCGCSATGEIYTWRS